jgi:hypothetical protein
MFFFVIKNSAPRKFCIWVNKKGWACVYDTRQLMWGVDAPWTVHVTPLDIPKMPFHHFIGSITVFFSWWCDACFNWCLSLGTMDLSFSFSFFSLFSLKNYSLTLLIVDISTSVPILLISNFLFWSFYRSFICF